MKKWITSNYHYMVPEYDGNEIKPNFSHFYQSVERGIKFLGKDKAVAVVIGPVTMAYLINIKSFATGCEQELRRGLLTELQQAYQNMLKSLTDIGCQEVQIHEAALVFEDEKLLEMYRSVYPEILPKGLTINIVSFMEDVGKAHYQWLISVKEFAILSLDFTRGNTIKLIEEMGFPGDKTLGAGIIDARNVWSIDPGVICPLLRRLEQHVVHIRVQPSASLQFNPWSLKGEDSLLQHPAGSVLSFATEKLNEIALLSAAVNDYAVLTTVADRWKKYRAVVLSDLTVQDRISRISAKDFERQDPFHVRRPKQLKGLPMLPTTTIGSFPQTKEIRILRMKFKKGIITKDQYESEIDQQIAYSIGIQECLGLDILVHGEPERTDMVEFFGEQLDGVLISKNGWVQSFGSRCVRPPIFWSSISRPHAMTVREFKVAQNLTVKPVKGMLTGPVTILNWSFPRADISRKEQAMQLALAIRDEIIDLESAGCTVIQVDEPALREAMPLRANEKDQYLTWAVDSFRLAVGVASSETQIHTHMCYCEFSDCMEAIDRLDVDANSIENARSDNATLLAFQKLGYNKDLGPGTYDIHSPVIPPTAFIYEKIKTFLSCIEASNLIINPDCGLKTRSWPEVIGALKNMIEATQQIREEFNAGPLQCSN
jgi:5-methyltetrahydropteroyltriglutamate--homocysteine methyltransferase